MLYLGIVSFAFFFLSDLNDALWKKRCLVFLYPVGMVGLVGATTGLVLQAANAKTFRIEPFPVFYFLMSVLFFIFTVYSLFFALPVADSYGKPGDVRRTCDKGVYALCRHPAMIGIAAMYMCLWAARAVPGYCAVLFACLNLLLVAFEDRFVFMRLLSDYGEYKKNTPFLIPNKTSVVKCIQDIRHLAERNVLP